MIHCDGSDDRDDRSHRVGRIEPSTHASFENDDIACGLGKCFEREHRRYLKKRRRVRTFRAEFAQPREVAGHELTRNPLAVDLDTLTKIDQMRRGVKTGAVPGPAQDRIQHRANRAFAIGASDVENPEPIVRVTASIKETNRILEPELDAELLRRIKPCQRLLVGHLADR